MAAPPYPKIENLYASKDGGEARAIGVLKRPARTEQIARWLCTEKIDGTNIRVSLEPHAATSVWVVRFYGRTNKAQMPDFIQECLVEMIDAARLMRLWKCRRSCSVCGGEGRLPIINPNDLKADGGTLPCPNVVPYPITLYGEAYGAGIQGGGGDYRQDGDVSFRLFDVLVGEEHWLTWENVVDVAKVVGIKTVPLVDVIDYGSPANCVRSPVNVKDNIVEYVRESFLSIVANEEGTPRLAEGIVARTDPYLFDNNGRRVVFKTKTKDF